MAQSGTISASRDNFRSMEIVILGVTQSTTSPVFHSFGYPIGSFAAEGVFDTSSAPTVNLQGSNDSGTTWFSVGNAITSSAPTGSFVGTNNEVFQLYRFNVSGGDSGTLLNFYIFLSATFG